MGGYYSGRYRRGSSPKRNPVREMTLILEARELVKRAIIRGDKRHSASIGSVAVGAAPRGYIAGLLYVDAKDTLPLWVQSEPRHRMELGVMRLEYTWRGSPP